MANDGGMVAKLEQRIADILAALTVDDVLVFKKALVWKWQLSPDAGGIEKFSELSPFAFVGFLSAEAVREGGYDLKQQLEFGIMVGIESKGDGIARTGDATHLGISKIRELVIAALDRQHPGSGFNCDDFSYEGETVWVDFPKRFAIQMNFTINWLM